ncbi:MAG: hypothetical protein LBQ41_01285 [Candidatus Ancillula sp.]|jgi:hypothetical protein|nr:hypothetical protein [Candidatus Ancillula sp.]
MKLLTSFLSRLKVEQVFRLKFLAFVIPFCWYVLVDFVFNPMWSTNDGHQLAVLTHELGTASPLWDMQTILFSLFSKHYLPALLVMSLVSALSLFNFIRVYLKFSNSSTKERWAFSIIVFYSLLPVYWTFNASFFPSTNYLPLGLFLLSFLFEIYHIRAAFFSQFHKVVLLALVLFWISETRRDAMYAEYLMALIFALVFFLSKRYRTNQGVYSEIIVDELTNHHGGKATLVVPTGATTNVRGGFNVKRRILFGKILLIVLVLSFSFSFAQVRSVLGVPVADPAGADWVSTGVSVPIMIDAKAILDSPNLEYISYDDNKWFEDHGFNLECLKGFRPNISDPIKGCYVLAMTKYQASQQEFLRRSLNVAFYHPEHTMTTYLTFIRPLIDPTYELFGLQNWVAAGWKDVDVWMRDLDVNANCNKICQMFDFAARATFRVPILSVLISAGGVQIFAFIVCLFVGIRKKKYAPLLFFTPLMCSYAVLAVSAPVQLPVYSYLGIVMAPLAVILFREEVRQKPSSDVE